MNKDRIEGAAEQTKGAVKEAAGKALGDKKLEVDGKANTSSMVLPGPNASLPV